MVENTDFFDTLTIPNIRNEALYVYLYKAINTAITQGILASGYRLPPIRTLAKKLQINPGTVASAYKELEHNGFIFSRPGSGSTVAEHARKDFASYDELPDIGNFSLDNSMDDIINMRSIALNPDIVSIDQFKDLFNLVLERDHALSFIVDDSRGFQSLRESIACKLAENSIFVNMNNIQVVSGAQQGIDLIARSLISHGDYVITESPVYPGAIAAFRAIGAKVISFPLESDGPDLINLENKLKTFRPKLIYTMPTLQNPTTISYSNEKRIRLMGLARFYNCLILENDYLGDLIYKNSEFKTLKSLDTDDRVIYLKSLSQIFMPGLHIGFLVTPTSSNKRIAKVKRLVDLSSSGLSQRVLDLYLRKKLWDTHLRKIRSIYSQRFEFTIRLLKKHLPDLINWQIPLGGLSFWLQLPDNISCKELITIAKSRGLLLTDCREFFLSKSCDNYLRLSFSLLSPQEIEKGIHILSDVLKNY